MARRASGAGARGTNNGTPPHRLTKEELLAQLRQREEDYEYPGFGTVHIRSIALKEFGVLQGFTNINERADALKRICLLGVIDPQLEPADLEALAEADVGAVGDLALRIISLSGQNTEAVEAFLAAGQTSKE